MLALRLYSILYIFLTAIYLPSVVALLFSL